MRVLLVALRDVKVGTFGSPLTAMTPGEAERTYQEILTRIGPEIVRQHPNDFPLYEIGSYDLETGQVFPVYNADGIGMPPRLMVEAQQLLGPRLEKEAK